MLGLGDKIKYHHILTKLLQYQYCINIVGMTVRPSIHPSLVNRLSKIGAQGQQL